MKVILYMAISLNGIIARENNEEDFLSHNNWITFVELAKQCGCMMWGRKTHEIVKTWEEQYFKDIEGIKKVIVSSDTSYDPGQGFERVNSPEEALKKLSAAGFESVIVTGGSGLNTSFAKAGLIDEIILNIEPVVIGKGIPLFAPEEFDLKLELQETKTISDNIIQVNYKVEK